MSGVIMNGVQYEHCCQCGKYVKLSELVYGKVRSDLVRRWPQYEMQDLCTECVEPGSDIDPMIWTDEDYGPVPESEEQLRYRVEAALDHALDRDSPLLNWHLWEEAQHRVTACGDLNGVDPEQLTWGTYEYLLGGDEEAELQLDDDRWAEAHMRASAFTQVTADDYPIISRGIYKQLCEEGWHA